MLKILIIDDSNCKKEFNTFIKKQKDAVKAIITTSELFKQNLVLAGDSKDRLLNEKKLAVNTSDAVCVLSPSEIIHCESSRNYTLFHLTGNRQFIASKNLMEYDKQLAKYSRFIRIHKSHLINIDFMEKYVKTDGGYVVLTDSTRLPVATRKKELLFRELERL